jgi:hypothetical protein
MTDRYAEAHKYPATIEINAELAEPDRKLSWRASILTWLLLSVALWVLLILAVRAI